MSIEKIKKNTTRKSEARFGLWQLISPTLPVGAYSFSQGLEMAIEQGWIHDQDTAYDWISGVASKNMSQLDLPILIRCYRATLVDSISDLEHWNSLLISSRETHELRMEDVQMGQALLRVMNGIESEESNSAYLKTLKKVKEHMGEKPELSYACSFALATSYWQISLEDACAGYLWAWCENQVAAAIKLVPLGQTAGQQLLRKLAAGLPEIQTDALNYEDDEIGSTMMGLAMVSSWHETQYTRLFRS